MLGIGKENKDLIKKLKNNIKMAVREVEGK